MSRFNGYYYPELTHFFGVRAMQRLEKKIHPRFIQDMEIALLEGILDNQHESEFVESLEALPF